MLRTPMLLAAVAAFLLAAAPAQAENAVALFPGNAIGVFDTDAPAALETRAVTGLGANQTLRGIDVRPLDGKLYGIAFTTGSSNNSVAFTYTIDPATGAAAAVGSASLPIPGAGDLPTGVAFDAKYDRLRVVNANDEHFRINPANGSLAWNDIDLTPAAETEAVALASRPDTSVAIDHADDSVAMIGAGGGALPLFGLGFGLANVGTGGPDAGFDVSPNSGKAFAALADASEIAMRLYEIGGLGSELRGPIGTGETNVYSLAILPDPPAPAPEPEPPAPAPDPQPAEPLATGDTAPPPPARDTTAPAAKLDVKPRLRLRALERGLRVGYGVDEACLAVARIRVGQTVLANARGSVPAAGAGTLRLALTRAGRRALPRLRQLGAARARVELSATDPAGNRTILGKRVRLGAGPS